MKEDMAYEPIRFHKPGQCPNCLGKLTCVDAERSIMHLNADGFPADEETTITVALICSKCGIIMDAIRDGLGYKPITPGAYYLNMAKINREKKERIDQQKYDPANPFKNF